MKYKLTFIILILVTLIQKSVAQNSNVKVSGVITSGVRTVENAHIINISSNRASTSNSDGAFVISAKENDTIKISNIQYHTQQIIITREILKNEKLSVELVLKSNELDEIVLMESRNMAKTLNLPNAGKKPLNQLERRLNYYSQAPTAMVILGTLLGQRGGIEDLYNIISGNRKRDRKLKKLIDDDELHAYNQSKLVEIRAHFTDDFFIETLSIQENQINAFLNHCLSKDIVSLYNMERYLDITDIFLKELPYFNENE